MAMAGITHIWALIGRLCAEGDQWQVGRGGDGTRVIPTLARVSSLSPLWAAVLGSHVAAEVTNQMRERGLAVWTVKGLQSPTTLLNMEVRNGCNNQGREGAKSSERRYLHRYPVSLSTRLLSFPLCPRHH